MVITKQIAKIFLEPILRAGSWDLVNLNSNSFSDELSQFICGQVVINRTEPGKYVTTVNLVSHQGLPKYILEVPPDMRTT